MVSWVWGIMLVIGLVTLVLSGKSDIAVSSLLDGANASVQLCIALAGGYLLWMGLLNVVEKSKAMEGISKKSKFIILKLFPGIDSKASALITLNLTANMMGMGNAATPFGLRAMEQLQLSNPDKSVATNAMCMLLILNTCSVQLVPTTIISLRAAAGSVSAADIMPATLLSSALCTLFAICLGKWFEKYSSRRIGLRK